MKPIILLFFACLPLLSFSQAQVIMNNDAYIRIGAGTYLVLDNGNANALTQTGTGGRIITEGETNLVRWNISNNTGTYVVPFFDDDNALEMPLTVTIGSAGSAGGRIDFSTYDGASWDNNTYRPGDVTNMNSAIGGANNSAKVIDRFWIIDAGSYTTKPNATLAFTYLDAEWNPAGNSITEGNMGAQRFNTPAGNWDAYTPQGTISTAGNTVVGVPANAADFFRSWTLSDVTSPLPIELIKLEGRCMDKNVVISWSTATETNNQFFTIERSGDGVKFEAIATLDGAGNSSTMRNYSYTDNGSLPAGAYYRLEQTDFDGKNHSFSTIYVAACSDPNSGIDVYSQGSNEFTVQIRNSIPGNYVITIYNTIGQAVTSKTIYAENGRYSAAIQPENINDAMYFVNISNDAGISVTRRVIINQ
jgi:hypothetical protein